MSADDESSLDELIAQLRERTEDLKDFNARMRAEADQSDAEYAELKAFWQDPVEYLQSPTMVTAIRRFIRDNQ